LPWVISQQGLAPKEREFLLPKLTRLLPPGRVASNEEEPRHVARILERIEDKLAQIQLTQDRAIGLLSAQSTMLTALLLKAPKLILFLPVAQATGEGQGISWLSRALSPKDWFNHRVRTFFVAAHLHTVAKTHPNDEGDA
jgi:hypothetical protein